MPGKMDKYRTTAAEESWDFYMRQNVSYPPPTDAAGAEAIVLDLIARGIYSIDDPEVAWMRRRIETEFGRAE